MSHKKIPCSQGIFLCLSASNISFLRYLKAIAHFAFTLVSMTFRIRLKNGLSATHFTLLVSGTGKRLRS